MSDGQVLLAWVIGIVLLLVLVPMIVGALNEAGHIKKPTFGKKPPMTFRQFPLNPPEDTDAK